MYDPKNRYRYFYVYIFLLFFQHHENNNPYKRVSDDHNSDTSGETIPSDSGRGASEDEVQSISHSHTSGK